MVKPAQSVLIEAAFDQIAERLNGVVPEWWIIGSAALSLHGLAPLEIADIDILVPDVAGAGEVIERLNASIVHKRDHPQFQSELFATASLAGFDVEVMSGFRYKTSDEWQRLVPTSRMEFVRVKGSLYAPKLDDLVEILHQFGRPKDLDRIALIKRYFAL